MQLLNKQNINLLLVVQVDFRVTKIYKLRNIIINFEILIKDNIEIALYNCQVYTIP